VQFKTAFSALESGARVKRIVMKQPPFSSRCEE
jgi:hypothetical protein